MTGSDQVNLPETKDHVQNPAGTSERGVNQSGAVAQQKLTDAAIPAAPHATTHPTDSTPQAAQSSPAASRDISEHFGGGHAEQSEDTNPFENIMPGATGGVGSRNSVVRETIMQAQLAEGTSSVTNMSIAVADKTLQGPVSFNQQGSQFLVDPAAGKYRILPADENGPNGYLQPYGKGDMQPIPIQSMKALTGDGGFGNWGWDGGAAPTFQPKPPEVPKSDTAAGAPVPPGDNTAHAAAAAATPGAPHSTTDAAPATPAVPSDAPPKLTGGITNDAPQTSALSMPGGFSFRHDGTLIGPDGSALGAVPHDQVGSFQQVLGIMTNGSPQSQSFINALSSLGRSDAPAMMDSSSTAGSGAVKDIGALLQQLSATGDPRLQGLGQIIQQALGNPMGVTVDGGAQGPGGKPGAAGDGIPIPMPGNEIGIGAGGDKAGATIKATESQLDLRLAAQLANPAARQALGDVLSQLQLGRSPFAPNSAEGAQLRGIIDHLGGPDGLQNLKILLLDTKGQQPPRLDSMLSLDQQQKLRELISLIIKGTQQQAEAPPAAAAPGDRAVRSEATQKPEPAAPQERPVDRIMDALRLQQISKVPNEAETKLLINTLVKSFNDFNASREEANQRPLSLQELIQRSLTNDASSRTLMVKPEHANDNIVATLIATIKPTAETVKVDDAMRNIIRKENESNESAGRKPNINVDEHTANAQRRTELKADPDTKVAATTKPATDEHEEAAKRRKRQDQPTASAEQIAEAAALVAKKKRKTEKEKDEQESVTEKKDPDKRQRYIVKQGDTLESIAEKVLRDKRLAGLIYEINKKAIATEILDGKTVPKLRARMVLWLPTPAESTDYRHSLASGLAPHVVHESGADHKPDTAKGTDELTARFGDNWAGATEHTAPIGSQSEVEPTSTVPAFMPPPPAQPPRPATASSPPPVQRPGESLEDMQEAAAAFYSERRKRIEEMLGPIKPVEPDDPRTRHVARLGDTLKSIAMNHPALRDVKLWKLLAHINNLSDEVDDKSSPVAKLKRGQVLRLPSQEQITAYRAGQLRGQDANPLGIFTAACPQCGRETFVSAKLCPRCGATMPGAKVHVQSDTAEPTQTLSPTDTVAVVQQRPPAEETKPAANRAAVTVERILNDDGTVRITRFGSPTDLATGFRVSLEVKRGAIWMPAIVYEFLDKGMARHEYKKDGRRKSMQVDLPIAAAIQMAYNDINNNWKEQV